MLITIHYPLDSNITTTNPLIRALFINSIKSSVKTVIGCRTLEPLNFEFIGEEFVISDYSVNIVCHNFMDKELFKKDIEDLLEREWEICYRSIAKFENLLDMFGGVDPQKLYGATCFKEMEL